MDYNIPRGEQKRHVTDASWVCRQNPQVAIEDFGTRSLALHCAELRLVELNATARELIARLNGGSTLGHIAAAIAETYRQPSEAVLADVLASVAQMARLGLIERVRPEDEAATPS